MPALGADIEDFLAKVLDARVLDKARQICITEEIFNVATLVDLRDGNELKDIFARGTAAQIRKALPGQLWLMLVTGVAGDVRFNESILLCFAPQLRLLLTRLLLWLRQVRPCRTLSTPSVIAP